MIRFGSRKWRRSITDSATSARGEQQERRQRRSCRRSASPIAATEQPGAERRAPSPAGVRNDAPISGIRGRRTGRRIRDPLDDDREPARRRRGPSTAAPAATAAVIGAPVIARRRPASRRAARGDTGERLERERGLVHEHPETVRARRRPGRAPRRGAASRPGGTRCRRRAGVPTSSVGGNGGALPAHPERRRVHDDVARIDGRCDLGEAPTACPPGRERRGRSAASSRAGRDGHRRAVLAQRARRSPARHRRRRARRPVSAGRARSPSSTSERTSPSPSVESPNSRRSRATTMFTAPRSAGGRRELVARRRGRRLVRHRDAEAGDLERADAVERAVRASSLRHVERDEDPVEAQRRERGVVDRR